MQSISLMHKFSMLLIGLHSLCRFDVGKRCRKSLKIAEFDFGFDLRGPLVCVSWWSDYFYIHGGERTIPICSLMLASSSQFIACVISKFSHRYN